MATNNADTEGAANNNQAETVEPSNPTANTTARRNASEPRKSSIASAIQPPPLRKQPSNSLLPVGSPLAGTSPRTSRNTSPVRKDSRPQPLSTPISTQPSAAAIQRALSAANAPQLQAGGVSEAVSRLPRAPKGGTGSGETTPHWPTSPRLKSPPPSGSGPNSRRGSSTAQQKKPETSIAPSISVQSATPQISTPPPPPKQDEGLKTPPPQTPGKNTSRGASGKSTLETVQENSTDDVREPSPAAVKAAADLRPLTRLSEDDDAPGKREKNTVETEKHTQPGESGSESAGAKSTKQKAQSSDTYRPKSTHTKSYTPLSSAKSRQSEGKQNMTVETETVPSIPQSALSTGERSGGGRVDLNGSVRLKPSNETIRPKKERKRALKPRSITQGTASSKADIFEARVANEVDNANSSDSEETFVYESNPPEPQRRARHHSRTPSVTSSHSTADQQRSGIRSFGDAMDERRVAGKRSMKFSNNPYNDFESPDGKNGGSMRSHTPRHFGRFGRGGSHASMFDQDSPFTQASKLRSNHLHGSRPNSPRSPQSMQQQQRSSGLFGKKKEPSFDFDAEGGDDERTPLVGTIRTPRSGRLPRRMNSSPSIDEYYGVRRQSRCGRFGGCLLGLVVFTAVILSAVAFLVMSNRPMYEVRIHKIQDVLASEQEIMLDLLVAAVNPNALGITITDMDVNVFAKSTHVGGIESLQEHGYGSLTASRSQTPRKRRRRVLQKSQESTPHAPNYWQDLSSHWHAPAPAGGVDEGTDPDEDLEGDAQTILLGRITHFDQGLSFEGSPLKRHLHYSVGEMRLAKPGNKTETGGSVKWEKVLQYPFQLIIRGVLKYELPISSRMESVSVGANITVYPDEDVDEHGAMRLTPVYKSERLRWIDQDDLEDAVAGIEAVQGGSVVEVEV